LAIDDEFGAGAANFLPAVAGDSAVDVASGGANAKKGVEAAAEDVGGWAADFGPVDAVGGPFVDAVAGGGEAEDLGGWRGC